MFELTFQLDAATSKMLLKVAEQLDAKGLYKLLLELFAKLATKAAGFITATQLSGNPLRRRTGSLAKSVAGRAMMVNGVPAFRVGVFRGPAVAYARIQEHGGTVRPVRAKALAMPVDDALTPAGVDRYGGPRQYPGRLTFVPFRNSGVAVGALYDAASLKAVTHSKTVNYAAARRLYVLLKMAKIPARHYLRNGLRNYLPYIASELAGFLKGWVSAAQRPA